MQNSDLARRVQTGHGLLLDGSSPAFSYVDVAKLVDLVALGTTVNAEALHDDLNQLAARVATATEYGSRPDAAGAIDALSRVESTSTEARPHARTPRSSSIPASRGAVTRSIRPSSFSRRSPPA